jgi:hypothetical protein
MQQTDRERELYEQMDRVMTAAIAATDAAQKALSSPVETARVQVWNQMLAAGLEADRQRRAETAAMLRAIHVPTERRPSRRERRAAQRAAGPDAAPAQPRGTRRRPPPKGDSPDP